mgnify:CR=1 FL=1
MCVQYVQLYAGPIKCKDRRAVDQNDADNIEAYAIIIDETLSR